jgi:uncharacterized protein (TIGR03435 family)
MIGPNLVSALGNHLWQSTAFAVAAWPAAVALRQNQARTRYWLWFAASLKFLVPFWLLFAVGSCLRPAVAPPIARADVSTAMTQMAQPFSVDAPVGLFLASGGVTQTRYLLPILLAALWACGVAGIAFCWWVRWRRVRKAVRAASPLGLPAEVPVVSSRSLLEPGIFGILRPVLVLPDEIAKRLTRPQLDAVIAHEMCHVRRRDNLAAVIHMVVEAVFWFNPVVWWVGARLVEERENACDEEVLRLGGEREVYAEGILNVCKFYTESPVPCVSGISGSDLKNRITRIMTQRLAAQLTFSRKVLLGAIAAAAIAAPLVFGVVNAPLLRAQSSESPQAADGPLPSFEVASIKEDHSGTQNHLFQFPSPSRFHTINIQAKMMIAFAYNIKDFQLSGAPPWASSIGYEIDAKIDDALAAKMQKMTRREQGDEMRLMMRSLLADRFKLSMSSEMKELPVYALVVAKGGPKLTPTAWAEPDPHAPKPSTPPQNGPHLMLGRGKISAVDQPVSGLADLLALMPDLGGRLVVDQTGIKGNYDFEMHFNSEGVAPKGPEAASVPPPDDSEPSIFTALEEQMGLKLESTKGPVEVYTIEHIEQPSEN